MPSDRVFYSLLLRIYSAACARGSLRSIQPRGSDGRSRPAARARRGRPLSAQFSRRSTGAACAYHHRRIRRQTLIRPPRRPRAGHAARSRSRARPSSGGRDTRCSPGAPHHGLLDK
eukprot:1189774-Prorocentrum_minimum.AAC.3